MKLNLGKAVSGIAAGIGHLKKGTGNAFRSIPKGTSVTGYHVGNIGPLFNKNRSPSPHSPASPVSDLREPKTDLADLLGESGTSELNVCPADLFEDDMLCGFGLDEQDNRSKRSEPSSRETDEGSERGSQREGRSPYLVLGGVAVAMVGAVKHLQNRRDSNESFKSAVNHNSSRSSSSGGSFHTACNSLHESGERAERSDQAVHTKDQAVQTDAKEGIATRGIKELPQSPLLREERGIADALQILEGQMDQVEKSIENSPKGGREDFNAELVKEMCGALESKIEEIVDEGQALVDTMERMGTARDEDRNSLNYDDSNRKLKEALSEAENAFDFASQTDSSAVESILTELNAVSQSLEKIQGNISGGTQALGTYLKSIANEGAPESSEPAPELGLLEIAKELRDIKGNTVPYIRRQISEQNLLSSSEIKTSYNDLSIQFGKTTRKLEALQILVLKKVYLSVIQSQISTLSEKSESDKSDSEMKTTSAINKKLIDLKNMKHRRDKSIKNELNQKRLDPFDIVVQPPSLEQGGIGRDEAKERGLHRRSNEGAIYDPVLKRNIRFRLSRHCTDSWGMRTGLKANEKSGAHQLAKAYEETFQAVQGEVMANLKEKHGVRVEFNGDGLAVDNRNVPINPDGMLIQLLSDAVNKNGHNSAELNAVMEDNSGLSGIYSDALAGLKEMETLFEYS